MIGGVYGNEKSLAETIPQTGVAKANSQRILATHEGANFKPGGPNQK